MVPEYRCVPVVFAFTDNSAYSKSSYCPDVSLDESLIHLVNHLVKRAGQRLDREPMSDSRKRLAARDEIGQATSKPP